MKKFLLILLAFVAATTKGQTNAQISYVTVVPTGPCQARANLRLQVPSGVVYTCQSGVWGAASGGAGTITGLTTNTIPKASSPTTLNNSNLLQNTDGSLTPSRALDIPIPSTPTFNAAGTTTCDFSLSNACHPGTMTGATTLAVTNAHGTGPYYLIWTQDGTGGRVPTYPGSFNATVCPPSSTPSVTTFITIVFNIIGATYDGITCTSNDSPTAIIGSERTAIASTIAGLGALTFDGGNHTATYYANNSANKHIMPRTVGGTDQLSCADLAGGCTGGSPAGSAHCLQGYGTSTTFESGCANGEYVGALTIQSAANTTLMGRLTPGFDGDVPIAGSFDAGVTATIDMGVGTTTGAYLALVPFNNSATPKTVQVGSFELDGHLNANGTNGLEDFQILDQSTGNPTSGKTVFGVNLLTPMGVSPPCTTPCANLDSGGTFFVGSQIATLIQASGYKSSDGTVGTTGNGFKNGLCTTASGACSTVLRGTSSTLSGALTIGTCNTTTVTVTGASTAMVAQVSPVSNPDTGATGLVRWDGYVSSSNTVTVRECGLGVVTPNATAYNVAVIP